MQNLTTGNGAYWMSRSACKRLIGSANEKSYAIAMITHAGKRTHVCVNDWQENVFRIALTCLI